MKEKKNILAVIMSLFMILSLLPVPVSAAELTMLDGKLKIQGTAMAGSTLSAEFKDVKPEGLEEDSVTYVWYRKTTDDEAAEQAGETPELKELSKDKTYKVTKEDIGSKIVLEITGVEENGFTGTLKAVTDSVAEKAKDSQTDATETTEAAEAEQVAEETETSEAEADDKASDDLEQATNEDAISETPEPAEDSSGSEDGSYESTDIPEATGDDSEEKAGDASIEGIPVATGDGTYGGDTAGNSEKNPEAEDQTEDSSDAPADYYQASASVDGTDSDVMDFGTVVSGSEDNTEGQFVTVTNTGNDTLHFTEISPEHFVVQDITAPLEAGESVQLWVSPRAGSEPGSYEDTITYTSEEGAQASFIARVTVQAADQNGEEPVLTPAGEPTEEPSETPAEEPTEIPEDPAGTGDSGSVLTSEDTLLNTNGQPLTVTVTNSSSEAITVAATSQNGNVTVTPASAVIEADASVDFTVAPAEDLNKETEYIDQVHIQDINNPSNTVTSEVSVKIAGSILNAVDPDRKFGTIVDQYDDLPSAQSVEIQNTGSVDATGLTVTSEYGTPKYFSASLSSDTIGAGDSATVTLTPTGNFTGGNTYTEAFTVMDDSGSSTMVKAEITVETAHHEISINQDGKKLDFATTKKGYSEVQEKSFTVTNNGNVTETLNQPSASAFQINAVDAQALILAPGESVTFKVSPKMGLDVNTYNETVNITSATSTEAADNVNLVFQVVKGTASLTKIRKPSKIKGLANGTRKEASALKLPSTVVIETTNGKMKASVTWNVKKCSYDPSSTKAQSFTVKGTVTLPTGVDNDNQISLTTVVKVNVKAYSAKQAQADNNKITGIEYNGVYTTQSRISFTAIGAGMDNGSPRSGDTRYIPLNWTVLDTNTNGWTAAPYTASFGLAKSGDYTLKVTFRQQQYDGKTWKDSETYDTKQVPFSITKAKVTAPGLDITPAANQKKSVKTGDNTPIAPFVIILAIAVGAIGGVFYYKYKNKRK